MFHSLGTCGSRETRLGVGGVFFSRLLPLGLVSALRNTTCYTLRSRLSQTDLLSNTKVGVRATHDR